jgi:benzylsuccinate CoA-transferase BbsF subunit
MSKGVFEGVKVAEFCWIAVGPASIKFLADQGAKVVRIESTTRMTGLRATPPFLDNKPGLNRSGAFNLFDPNRYSLALNMQHPRSMEVAKRLVAWADIVAENFSVGTMEKWGLGYEELKQINPGIIMFRTCNQGQTGPHAKVLGFGVHLQGLTGYTHLTGYPDRDPSPPFGTYTDYVSMLFGGTMLIAALEHRRRTGKGQCLDLSQFEASLHFLTPLILDYEVNRREANRAGNSCPYAAPHGAYRCQGDDRWCAIAVFTDEEWQSFCKVIGNPEWTQEPRFATLVGRKQNEDELNALVEKWTKNFPPEEVMTQMQNAGVAAGVVKNPKDIFEDPQLKHQEAYYMLEHKEMGVYPVYGKPFNLSKTPAQVNRPAPCFGEHTEYVCREFLGMSEEEFDDLLVSGVFE